MGLNERLGSGLGVELKMNNMDIREYIYISTGANIMDYKLPISTKNQDSE
jgi:hypothetical protein